jgi:hypothetical protein
MGHPAGRDLGWRHQQGVDRCGYRRELWIVSWTSCGYPQTYGGFLHQGSVSRCARRRRNGPRAPNGATRPSGCRGRRVVSRPRLPAPGPHRFAGTGGPLSHRRDSARRMLVHLGLCAWIHQHAETAPRCRGLRGQVVLSEPGTPLRVGPAGCTGRDVGADSLTAKLIVDRCLAHGTHRKGSALGGVINMLWRAVDGPRACGCICVQAVERLGSSCACSATRGHPADPATPPSVTARP